MGKKVKFKALYPCNSLPLQLLLYYITMRYLSFFILAVIPALFMSFSSGGQSQNNVQIQDEPTMCTMQYDPVCGVDGVTYGNACSAGKTEIAYAGECALPDLQYCAAYYDGCNNCSVEE